MLNAFLTWWWRQLRDMLPRQLAGREGILPNALVIEPCATPRAGQSASVRLIARANGREGSMGEFALDHRGVQAMAALLRRKRPPGPTVLRAAPDMLLERSVVLPLAAERELAQVLGYEMDRNTPFESGDVFWTWSVEAREPDRQRLRVRLSVVPKASLAAWLPTLGRAGLNPTRLEAVRPGGPVRLIDLRQDAAARDRRTRRRVAAAAIACLVLTVSLAAVPFVVQALQRRDIEARIARIAPEVAEAEALRREMASRVAGNDVFEAQRAEVGNALEVLAAVTDALPNDTYLTELTLRGGKLQIGGQSTAAARLIAALSADPVLRNPVFAAPVTRQENRADQFSIRAEIATP